MTTATHEALYEALHAALTDTQAALSLHQMGVAVLEGNFKTRLADTLYLFARSALVMCDVTRDGVKGEGTTPNDLVQKYPEALGAIGRLTGALIPMVVGAMVDLELR